jgi:hypothetical protein
MQRCYQLCLLKGVLDDDIFRTSISNMFALHIKSNFHGYISFLPAYCFFLFYVNQSQQKNLNRKPRNHHLIITASPNPTDKALPASVFFFI